MKLKTAKTVLWILAAAVLLSVLVMAFVPYGWRTPVLVAGLVLLALMGVVSVAFLRCPNCGGHIHLFGMAYCPTCGRKIEE